MDRTPRLCNSAGHGLSSRTPGKVDPGTDVVGGNHENNIALGMATRFDADFAVLFAKLPGSYHLLRDAGVYYRPDDEAAAKKCDLFIEHHVNAGGGKGTEVLFESAASAPLAGALSTAIANALGRGNRGAKLATKIAVLNPHPGMRSVLIEWFFGDNIGDVKAWGTPRREAAELAAVNVILKHYGMRQVKSLPRTWGRVRRALYRPF